MFASMRRDALTPEAILTMVVERLRRELPGHDMSVQKDDPFRLQLCHPEAGELILNLGNIVHEIHGSPPSAAEQMISAYVSMAKKALLPPKIELSAVYPSLRHYEFLDAVKPSKDDPLIGEGPGDLVSVVLSDMGDGLAVLTEDAVEKAGFSTEDILHAAETNFVELLPHEVYTAERRGGVVSVGLDGFPWLGTSLLFVPAVINQVMTHYGWTRVLVSAPSRDTVDLVNADAPGALAEMEQWMQRQLSQPRTQSEFVLSMALDDELLTTTHRMSSGRLLGLN